MSEKSAGAAMTGQQGEREALARVLHADDLARGRAGLWLSYEAMTAGAREWYLDQADAALAYLAAQPPRVTPSAEAIRRAITDADDEFDRLDPSAEADWGDWEAEAVLALFAAQPTVQQVQEQVAAQIAVVRYPCPTVRAITAHVRIEEEVDRG